MTTKDIAEIRRRFRPEKTSISRIRGCFVNEAHQISATFNQSLGLMREEETEELLTILRKVLSGTQNKNLHPVAFSTAQVLEGEHHRRLTTLRDTALEDEAAVTALYEAVIANTAIEGSYMILLAADSYDYSGYRADGEKDEDSTKTFRYFVCALCPIKQTRPALGYLAEENRFCSLTGDQVIGAPALGFMFPAFDRRAANIYEALYYTHDTADNHPDFVSAVLDGELPPPAAVQKETFASVLAESVGEACSYEVAQTVHEQICVLAEFKPATRDEEDERPMVSKRMITGLLEDCGVDEPHVTAFGENYDRAFGVGTELPPANLVDKKRFDVTTPDVVIRVKPEASDLVQTRIIDGEKYILIRAEAGVEVNGFPIRIGEE